MPYHLVLSLEALTAFGPRAVWYGAVMWPVLGVYVCVGAIGKD